MLFLLAILAGITQSPIPGDTYTIHEKVQTGQKVVYVITQNSEDKCDAVTNGKPILTDTHVVQSWTVTENVLAAADGSATQARLDVDAASTDTTSDIGQPETTSPVAYAGKSIVVTNKPDGSVSDDFNGNVRSEDSEVLDGLLTADEDSFPDKPVSVGDTWDNSARLGKKMSLNPGDHFSDTGHLDWVKMIDGKPMAQITTKSVYTYHIIGSKQAGSISTDTDDRQTCTLLVDIAAGMIVKAEGDDTRKVTNPPTSTDKYNEVVTQTFHCTVVPDSSAGAAK